MINIDSFTYFTKENNDLLDNNKFISRKGIIYFIPKEEVLPDDVIDLTIISAVINKINFRSLRLKYKQLVSIQLAIDELKKRCAQVNTPIPALFCIPCSSFLWGFKNYVSLARRHWKQHNKQMNRARQKVLTKGACSIGLGCCPCVSDTRRSKWENTIIRSCKKNLSTNTTTIHLLTIGPGKMLPEHVLIDQLSKEGFKKIIFFFFDIHLDNDRLELLKRFWKLKAPKLVKFKKVDSLEEIPHQSIDVGYAMDFEPYEPTCIDTLLKEQQIARDTVKKVQLAVKTPILIFTKHSKIPMNIDGKREK